MNSHPQGASPEGLLNLGGNVSEWVWDWFAPYAEAAVLDPRGPDVGECLKIPSWWRFRETRDAMRVTDRVMANPFSRSERVGFRCGHEVPK